MVETLQEKDEFERLLETGYSYKIQVSDLVRGLVVKKDSDGYLVDIGTKSEAYLPHKEIVQYDKNNKPKDFSEWVNVGEVKDFYVVSEENENDQIILSLKRVACAKDWETLQDAKIKETVITVTAIKNVKGGIIVEYKNLRGFLPISHLKNVESLNNIIGQQLEVKVIVVNSTQNKLIFSQRMINEQNIAKSFDEILTELKSGDVVKGKVVRITNFGAFVNINGVDGLLPISEMSWKRIDKPSDVVKINDEIDVKVLKIDTENKRISLSIKRLFNGSWETVDKEFKEGQTVTGKIVNITKYGLFIELKPEIEALLPITELQDTNKYNIGDNIETIIKKMTPSEHRISLSLN